MAKVGFSALSLDSWLRYSSTTNLSGMTTLCFPVSILESQVGTVGIAVRKYFV